MSGSSQESPTNYKLKLSFDKIQAIALTGIRRAARFSKIAAVAKTDFDAVNQYRDDQQAILFDAAPPLSDEAEYQHWYAVYQNWVFCNSINEVIETFDLFLEQTVVVLELIGQKIPVLAGQSIESVIKQHQDSLREKYRWKYKKYLSQLGISFSVDEEKIYNSFFEIRHLLTHNAGIADFRKNLNVEEQKIILKWYGMDIELIGISGKKMPIDQPTSEPGNVHLQTKGMRTKTISPGNVLKFTCGEVQEICHTFHLMVIDISGKILKKIEEKNAA